MNIKRLLAVILAVLALLSFVGCNVKKTRAKSLSTPQEEKQTKPCRKISPKAPTRR